MRYIIAATDAAPILAIDQLGFASDPTVTRWGPGARNAYLIHYILTGRGIFNGRTVCAGEGFIITPGMHECYYPDEADPWSYVWLISSDPRMHDMLPYLHADPLTGVFRYDFVPYMRRLGDTLRSEAPGVTSGAALLERFMGVIRRHESPHQADEASAALRYATFAARYIEGNYQQPLTIAHLTAMLGVSQPYLCRVFHSHMGISPRQYITRLRLTQAKRLLAESAMPVTQVAISVGYDDALAFTRFFTKHQGISPTSYRRQATAKEDPT